MEHCAFSNFLALSDEGVLKDYKTIAFSSKLCAEMSVKKLLRVKEKGQVPMEQCQRMSLCVRDLQ